MFVFSLSLSLSLSLYSEKKRRLTYLLHLFKLSFHIIDGPADWLIGIIIVEAIIPINDPAERICGIAKCYKVYSCIWNLEKLKWSFLAILAIFEHSWGIYKGPSKT